MKYTINDLLRDYPDERSCLIWLAEYLYPEGITCKRCEQITKHYPIRNRKSLACGKCGSHMNPMVGTIFQNTHVPLMSWFYAIYQMAINKSGVTASSIQRAVGVTYKSAWRMMHQIRKLMEPPARPLEGEVEIDESFYHANTFKRSSAVRRYGRDPRCTGEVLFGALERRTGLVKVYHVATAGERILTPVIRQNIRPGSMIYSDSARAYDRLPNWGYYHTKTNHSRFQWVDKDNPRNYTQTIENFWSTWKPRMKGTYKTVSKRYLQQYLDEYAWRYSNRNKPNMFLSLMSQLG